MLLAFWSAYFPFELLFIVYLRKRKVTWVSVLENLVFNSNRASYSQVAPQVRVYGIYQWNRYWRDLKNMSCYLYVYHHVCRHYFRECIWRFSFLCIFSALTCSPVWKELAFISHGAKDSVTISEIISPAVSYDHGKGFIAFK